MSAKHIRVEFSEASLFGATDPAEENIDVPASIASFRENLENALEDEYPGAEVEVIASINDTHSVDGRTDNPLCPRVGNTVNKVWSNWQWEVYL